MGLLISLQKTVVIFFPLFLAIITAPDSALGGGKDSHAQGSASLTVILDGMRFIGPTGEKGKKTHHEDVLSFNDGMFTSSECFQFGFRGGAYSAWVNGNIIHFQAVTISPTHGKMEWEGTVEGNILTANYSWTKKRWLWTTYREYWFKGTLIKE